MKLPDNAVTLKEFQKIINSFISEKCQKVSGHLVHKHGFNYTYACRASIKRDPSEKPKLVN